MHSHDLTKNITELVDSLVSDRLTAAREAIRSEYRVVLKSTLDRLARSFAEAAAHAVTHGNGPTIARTPGRGRIARITRATGNTTTEQTTNILTLLRQSGGKMRNVDLRKKTGLSKARFDKAIKPLVAGGQLARSGSRGGASLSVREVNGASAALN